MQAYGEPRPSGTSVNWDTQNPAAPLTIFFEGFFKDYICELFFSTRNHWDSLLIKI